MSHPIPSVVANASPAIAADAALRDALGECAREDAAGRPMGPWRRRAMEALQDLGLVDARLAGGAVVGWNLTAAGRLAHRFFQGGAVADPAFGGS